ncbi:MAG: choice-of-anchor V domain-containing protein [Candidatus Solibacter sp.]
MERQRKIYVAKVAIIMGAIPLLLWARSDGPVSGSAGVPGENTCAQAKCHVGTAINDGGGSVKVSFPYGNTYIPGVKQHLVVTIADPAARIWGFQLTARPANTSGTMAGSFTSTDNTTAVVCNKPPFIDFQDVYLDFGRSQTCPSNNPLAYVEHTDGGSGRSQAARNSFNYEFDWTPPVTDIGNIVIYVAGNGGNGNGQETGDHIYTATYTLSPGVAGLPPAIDTGGVVSGASFVPGVVPGSWVTIKGSNLSPVTDTWDKFIVNGNLPTSLGGVSVNIGSKLAYVYFVSPGQINVQAPDVGAGPVPVTVSTPGGTSIALTANVSAQAPAFFLWPGNQAVATRNSDNSLAVKDGTFAGATTVAAKPGDVLILWGTGFGPTSPAVPAGILTPGDKVYSTRDPVTVKIGSAEAQVFGAALSPGFAGLYQVAIQVPASMADGDYPLKAAISGITSPDGVILSVQK